MEGFNVPAKPWGDKEIKFLMANVSQLDNETRVELGLAEVEDAPEPTPSEEPVEEVVEEADKAGDGEEDGEEE